MAASRSAPADSIAKIAVYRRIKEWATRLGNDGIHCRKSKRACGSQNFDGSRCIRIKKGYAAPGLGLGRSKLARWGTAHPVDVGTDQPLSFAWKTPKILNSLRSENKELKHESDYGFAL